jgi:hypothetical protein
MEEAIKIVERKTLSQEQGQQMEQRYIDALLSSQV